MEIRSNFIEKSVARIAELLEIKGDFELRGSIIDN